MSATPTGAASAGAQAKVQANVSVDGGKSMKPGAIKGKCYRCGKEGHKEIDCRSKKPDKDKGGKKGEKKGGGRKGESDAKNSDPKPCYAFRDTGSCSREGCKFSHTRTSGGGGGAGNSPSRPIANAAVAGQVAPAGAAPMAAADTGFTPSEKAGIKKLFSSLGFSVNAAIASGDQHTEVDDDWFADAKVAILVADGETDNNQDCPGLCDNDSISDDFDTVQGKSESEEDEPPGLCDESSSEDGADFACKVDADSDEENPPGLCDDVSSDDDDDVPQVVQRKFDLDHDAIKLSKGMQQHFSMYTTAQDLARMLWLVDSGASRNFCKSREHFLSLLTCPLGL
jgi:hypothetical protein